MTVVVVVVVVVVQGRHSLLLLGSIIVTSVFIIIVDIRVSASFVTRRGERRRHSNCVLCFYFARRKEGLVGRLLLGIQLSPPC